MAILTTKILRVKKYTLYTMERTVTAGMQVGYHYFIVDHHNGIDYFFLIDTGASSTILDSLFTDKNIAGFPVKPSDLHLGAAARLITGGEIRVALIDCCILGLQAKWLCTGLHFLAEQSGLAIGGIIGADLMDMLNAKIDLRSRTIIFRNAR